MIGFLIGMLSEIVTEIVLQCKKGKREMRRVLSVKCGFLQVSEGENVTLQLQGKWPHNTAYVLIYICCLLIGKTVINTFIERKNIPLQVLQ